GVERTVALVPQVCPHRGREILSLTAPKVCRWHIAQFFEQVTAGEQLTVEQAVQVYRRGALRWAVEGRRVVVDADREIGLPVRESRPGMQVALQVPIDEAADRRHVRADPFRAAEPPGEHRGVLR